MPTAAFLLQLALAAAPTAPPADFGAGVEVGRLSDAALDEVSGIAPSRRTPGLWWVHNDSGDGPVLYAIDAHGALRGRLVVDDTMAFDWEDLASIELDGKPYLVVGDIGDNWNLRVRCNVVVVAEPELPQDGRPVHMRAAWRVNFRYADGPRDSEAMAVDVARREVVLLSKRLDPPLISSVPLQPPDEETLVATPRGTLAFPPKAISATAQLGRKRPTGLAFSDDGRHAAVLGYRELWIYRRAPGQDWIEALMGTPEVHTLPKLPQPEAVTFERDGSGILITGEKRGTPIVRMPAIAGVAGRR